MFEDFVLEFRPSSTFLVVILPLDNATQIAIENAAV